MNQLALLLILVVCFSTGFVLKRGVIVLNEDNWRQALHGEWMIKFYAPWCPACKANEADYNKFAEWSNDLNIKVGVVDITKEAGLSGRFMVTALPTFYHGIDGEFRRYNGGRSSDAMHDFIDQRQWRGVETIWWLRHPDSFQMTLMSLLFKTSIIMKDIHELLTDRYGLSTWMSYAVFGAGTLVTGLTLGLLLVCVVDCISPSRARRPVSQRKIPEDEEEEKTSHLDAEVEGGDESDGEETDASQQENTSQASQGSSRGSQEWETIQDAEVPDDPSHLRKRKVEKHENVKEAGDAPGVKPVSSPN